MTSDTMVNLTKLFDKIKLMSVEEFTQMLDRIELDTDMIKAYENIESIIVGECDGREN